MTMYSTFIEENAKQGYFLLPQAIELKSQVKKHSLILILIIGIFYLLDII